MIEQIFEFVVNHFVLVGIFFALLFALLVNEGKRGGASITSGTLVNLVNKQNAVVLDVRDRKDFAAGHIVDAVHIPYASLDQRLSEIEAFRDRPVVIVCKMGQHSSAVGSKLKAKGFDDVRRLGGGMAEWTASNLPVVKGKEKAEKDKGGKKGKGKGKAKDTADTLALDKPKDEAAPEKPNKDADSGT